ncbi:DEAD/DEAH box helicase [Ammoniphilus resinae]|uniref:Superfamily II DNA or RNA helicase n=1 Tax=Ammoniphilus resinae TaxID=861532 RepID=A0ABS4GU93_9BACL|nr:DEAD/DEAH box helicase [Ammoniphilus resinae]MBP1933622.1 superfamily II DNA or RNA helicase [Ammoniphilus resinae]
MMILHGAYVSEKMTDEYVFKVWMEEKGLVIDLPVQLRELLEDLQPGGENEVLLLPRIRLAEGLMILSTYSLAHAEELQFWIQLFSWTNALAAEGRFFPDLIHEDENFYAKWTFDPSDPKVKEELEDWARRSKDFLPVEQRRKKVMDFVEDVLDSFIRLVINTRISLNHSELGRLLKFKPFYLHEEWLHRLCMEEYLPGSGRRWAEMFTQMSGWGKGKAVDEGQVLGKLCLRVEPAQDDDSWKIRFLWVNPEDRLLEWGQLETDVLRHQFMQKITEVASTFPAFEDWQHVPFYCRITLIEAYRFVKEVAPQLRAQGVLVLAPRTLLQPSQGRVKVRLELQEFPEQHVGSLSLQTILHFNLKASLGGQELTAEELEQLKTNPNPYLRVGGQWVEVNGKELSESLHWLEEKGSSPALPLRDVLYLNAEREEQSLLPVWIESIEVKDWLEDWFRFMKEGVQLNPIPTPKSFQGILRPYQEIGMSWLIELRKWGMGACLSDDMGLGKTIQFLSYLAYCKEHDELKGPTLLICPTSVLGNWQKEIERFVPDLKVFIHYGADRLNGEDFKQAIMEKDLVVTTYSLIHRDFLFFMGIPWDTITLDEAQHIKNPQTLQAKAIRKLAGEHRIALTGTPVENRLAEFWAIFDFLNHGLLGSFSSFRREFINPVEKEQDKGRLETLKRLTKPLFLRRTKNDPAILLDLPEKIESKEFCMLTHEQAVLYQRVVDELMTQEKQATGMERRGLILASISRLKQICNHPQLFLKDALFKPERSGKLNRLLDMTGEMLAEGDRMLIFTQFAKMGELLKSTLEKSLGVPVLFLHGGVVKKRRDEMIEEFQEKEQGPPIFVLSLKAGGIGVNLTRANRVIHFDRWWNPAVENQATDRAYRLGQTRTVQVHKFITLGTIEEKIDEMIERKKGLVEDIIGMGEGWVTELSTNELQDLILLRHQLLDE